MCNSTPSPLALNQDSLARSGKVKDRSLLYYPETYVENPYLQPSTNHLPYIFCSISGFFFEDNHNFAPFCRRASLSLSLNRRRRILPLGLFGITSMNSTPPCEDVSSCIEWVDPPRQTFNHLCRAFSFSTCFCMSRMVIRSLSSKPTEDDLTT